MSHELADRVTRAKEMARIIMEDAAKNLLGCLGRTGEPNCMLVMVLDRPDRLRIARKLGRDPECFMAGVVVRFFATVREISEAVPDVAGLLEGRIALGEAYRILIDMGWATVEVFSLNEQDRSLAFARHVGAVQIRDEPVESGEEEADESEDEEP